jgi:hypothetical protein
VTDWAEKVESGRAIMAAPRLGRAQRVSLGPQDEKFALGDLLSDVEDDQLERLARGIGHNLTAATLKSYREVAGAWPSAQRVAASWTVHRTLKNLADRFDVIQPGMTLREAQIASGRTPADTEHPSRWSLERRVLFIITQLQDAATTKAVRDELEGRKRTRAAKAAVKMVDEDRSAEYRAALRELRDARDAKHPERAAYEVIFKLRDSREYVRAVGKMSGDDGGFLPDHRRPDVISAIRDLAVTALDAIALSGLKEEPLVAEVLAAVRAHLENLPGSEAADRFDAVIIQGEVDQPRAELLRPKTIDGRLV